jgi:hypothetical protein
MSSFLFRELREELLPEKYIEVAKKILNRTQAASCGFTGPSIAAILPAAFVFTAGRTVVLPPKGPELRCDST